ncbi:MAG: RNA polymerase sigma factor [Proteobacteria bacterium]|nr:RNA polymerase sigma factor [Pseudomonadota bacterium]
MSPTSDQSDNELARRAAKGDDEAFAALVRRHKEGLYRLLRRYTGNPEDAYEATHEAFIAAWRALDRYDPALPFIPWLRTIAINKVRDLGRRALVRRVLFGTRSTEEGEALAVADQAITPEQSFAATQTRDRLDRAIASLPAKLKQPLLLTAFEDFSQDEAAKALGISTKAVETRVYRARKLLSERLSDELRPTH